MDALLTASGLNTDQLTNLTGRVPTCYLERLVSACVEISKDPLIGLHISEKANSAGFGILGYIRQACSTLQEVIEMTIRYESLVIGKNTAANFDFHIRNVWPTWFFFQVVGNAKKTLPAIRL